MGLIFRFVVLLVVPASISGHETKESHVHPPWGYGGDLGPNNWAKEFHQCSGHNQSPIKITSTRTVHNPFLESIVFGDYEVTRGHVLTMFNNGKAVQVNLADGPYVEGGDLPGRYRGLQFHFHWGSSLSRGSEHILDSKQYPMELHIVHYAEKYRRVITAQAKSNGLAVLGFLFEVTLEDNPALVGLIENLRHISDPGQSTVLKGFSLKDILPTDLRQYYRYRGSLTTPPCLETVIWTIYPATIKISSTQLGEFRRLRKAPESMALHSNANFDSNIHEVYISDNYRPIQDLNGRMVYSNFIHCSGSADLAASFGIILLSIALMTEGCW